METGLYCVFPNSMVWIFSEYIDVPDTFHSWETYNYCGRSISIQFPINVHGLSIFPSLLYFTVSFFKDSCNFFKILPMQGRNFDGSNMLLKNKFIIMSFIFSKILATAANFRPCKKETLIMQTSF